MNSKIGYRKLIFRYFLVFFIVNYNVSVNVDNWIKSNCKIKNDATSLYTVWIEDE